MQTKSWMHVVLRLAAVYNLLWGGWVILFPNAFFDLVGMAQPTHPMIWQGMGMVIGVYCRVVWWAAAIPIKHWPIVAVGFLGKIFGPLGFVFNFLSDHVPGVFAYTLITNDFIWWIPFFLILKEVKKGGWTL